MRDNIFLKVVEGPLKGRSFMFDRHDHFIVGRSRSCHLHLPDDQFMSRHHFLLEVDPPLARVRDLGSLNGTFINGVKCGGRGQLEPPEAGEQYEFPQINLREADRIQIGQTIIRVCIEGSALAPAAIRCTVCGRITQHIEFSEDAGYYICKWCWQEVVKDPMPLIGAGVEIAVNPGAGRRTADLSSYTIVRPLGEGAKTAVHLAVDQTTREQVALKVVAVRALVDEKARATFLGEMEKLTRLQHSNVASFRGAGSKGGVFFVVLEYCNTGNVLQFMREHGGRLSVELAGSLMLDALSGLVYLHSQGCVHRDIKPHNVLLHEAQGHVHAKLADSGLTSAFDAAGLGGLTTTSKSHGSFLPYMPREQLTEHKVRNPVSDIWSLAATFYHMLAGAPPRDVERGRDPLEVILDAEIVPIEKRNGAIPGELAAVIDRALAISPSERFPSATEFGDAIAKSLESSR